MRLWCAGREDQAVLESSLTRFPVVAIHNIAIAARFVEVLSGVIEAEAEEGGRLRDGLQHPAARDLDDLDSLFPMPIEQGDDSISFGSGNQRERERADVAAASRGIEGDTSGEARGVESPGFVGGLYARR